MLPADNREVRLTVNGRDVVVEADRRTPLLYILRNDLGLNGPKFGCGLGECGACTVLIEGRAARSCVERLAAAEGRRVITLEGLGTRDHPGIVQRAFIAEQAAQCGYCLNGMIMGTHALLSANPAPTRAEIRKAMRHYLCRCGTHIEIVRAVEHAASLLRAEEEQR